ncbi:MAG: DNA translocase FtsK 4TM domain-containing protein, partial [Pseudomonadota bacterium]
MPQARAAETQAYADELRRESAFTRVLSGLAAFSLGVFVCGACGSYSPTDPSWNAAVDVAPSNLFGVVGAVGADVMTQMFGWTAWLAGFALMIGGLRRTFAIGPRRAKRWVWGALGVTLAGVCLAKWPIPAAWPLAIGLGGVLGERLLHLFSMPFAALAAPSPEMWAAIVAGVGSIVTAAMCMGFGARDGAALVHTLKRTAEGAGHVSVGAGARVVSGAGGVQSAGRRLAGLAKLLGRKSEPRRRSEPALFLEDDMFSTGERG